ncbi:hypothetical protein ES703_41240 [subsurface metagenome]
MKDELKAMEAHLKELKALKKYDEVKRLNQEVSELKARILELRSERDRLKREKLLRKKAEEEVCQLKEALNRTCEELSMLKEAKAILNGGYLTLEEAARDFVKAKEAEIGARVERELKGLKRNFEAKAPRLVYHKLLAILKKPDLPAEIAQVIEKRAEEKAQSRLDDEFRQGVNEEALNRLQELKRTEWRPFIEEEALRLGSNLKTLAAELQGTWHFVCDQCQSRVTVEIGPRQIAALLKGARVAECPRCRDFNLPPLPLLAPHKIDGSALEDLVEAYLADKGPLGKATMERNP